MRRFLVNHKDITQIKEDHVEPTPLNEGQVRIRIDRFALTANNVTYAAAGDVLKYWAFFPTGVDGYGLLPVWGFGDVVQSRSVHLPEGTRLYGFFPSAEELVITPDPSGDGVISDAAPHRAGLPPVYNRYILSKPRPPEQEAQQALLQPLLATSYLLQDWLSDNDFFNAKQIIVGSSSSKTGLGLCKYLAELDPRPVQIIGLTSERNLAFVGGLGACDQVLSYNQIQDIAHIPSVYVDMSGNAQVKQALHSHLAQDLRHSCAVGTSHWDKFIPQLELDGPKPEFFFAPAQIEKRRADWGPGVIEKQIGAAWRRLADGSGDWLDIRTHAGFDAMPALFQQIAQGTASPRDGHVISL